MSEVQHLKRAILEVHEDEEEKEDSLLIVHDENSKPKQESKYNHQINNIHVTRVDYSIDDHE